MWTWRHRWGRRRCQDKGPGQDRKDEESAGTGPGKGLLATQGQNQEILVGEGPNASKEGAVVQEFKVPKVSAVGKRARWARHVQLLKEGRGFQWPRRGGLHRSDYLHAGHQLCPPWRRLRGQNWMPVE